MITSTKKSMCFYATAENKIINAIKTFLLLTLCIFMYILKIMMSVILTTAKPPYNLLNLTMLETLITYLVRKESFEISYK